MDGDVSERRRADRIESAACPWARVRLRTGHEISLVNVSGGGALVETSARLLPGTAIVLHVVADAGTMAVRARVTRCSVCAIDKTAGVRYRGALAFADGPQAARPLEDSGYPLPLPFPQSSG